ncbi:ABC multidrug transporter [Histoplasma capsulatum G186AR]|uniref:ABC multidrug transporter n=1 Tax=Ajellomyces capsulatus TaxID=5037 RepID=A0A8H8D866_AJECA|nr:ABC multidrug transporter [Histoplasma capsulatum]QSS69965.1 ABC multidrug transporter [Histoplasma capsulatum G186AR]
MDNTQTEAGKQQSEPDQKPPFKNFWRILGHGTLLDKILMGIAVLCAAGAGTALPLMNVIFGNVVSDFNGYFIPGSGVTKEKFLSSVNRSVLFIVYLFIGKFLLGYISMFCLRMTGIRISARLRLSYLQALFNQPISVFDTLPVGRPTNTITTSSNTIQAGISDKLAILVQSLALVISAYAVAFRFSWSLTLVASASILFISILYSLLVPIYVKLQKKVEQADEKASSIAGEALGSIRTIVSCCAEGRLAARYGEWVGEARKRGMRLAPQVGAQLAPSNFAMYGSYALTFWFGVRQYASNNIPDVGPVITVIFSVLIVVSTLSFLATPIIAISKAVSASTYFFEMIDAPKPKTSGLKDQNVSTTDIRFEAVNFSYPTRPDVKILNNLTIDIPAGKITALVGPSGCGKSTIVGLLERWYQIESQFEGDPNSDAPQSGDPQNEKVHETTTSPNSGSIKIGPHNLYDLDLKWWRSQIGLVQQEPFTFNTTIYQNVAYGLVGSKWENESEEVKRKLVVEACRESFASEYIEKLPLGYDTMVGENGLKLSGGQRQRLAIARSIIKRPPILILDEATSSIDVRGERIVQEALDRVSKNRTTITIAHRLSTIKKADKIIVLRAGESIEQGTHEELLEFKGLYHTLVENQRLEMGEQDPDIQGQASPKRQVEDMQSILKEASRTDDAGGPDQAPVLTYKARSLVNSVGLFLWEQRKLWYLDVAIVIAAAGCGSAFAIQSYIFAQLTAVFQLSGDQLINRSEFWALMFFILALGVGFFYFVLGFSSTSLSANICGTYRQQYFEHIIAKPIEFFDEEGNSTGSLTSRLSTDPTQLQELVGHQMAFPLISVFNVIGCVSVAFSFGWKLTLVAIFSAFPLIILAMFIRVRYEIQFEKLNAAVFESSSQFASEAISAFRTVTSLTLEDTITTRYSALLQDHVEKAFLKARFATLIIAASDSIELPCMALCFWYGGQLLSTREYDVLRFMVIYISVVMGGQAAGQFGSLTPNLAQATVAANRILSVRPSENSNDGGKETVGRFEGGAQIDFKSINFKYPTRDVVVFKNLSFTIEKGQFAALVGPSGCGKSTVIGLLEKFYGYQSGTIAIDGHDLNTLDVSSYRQSVSLVSQEPALYQGSVKDNVLLGVDPAHFTDEDVQQACKDANIHDFISSLPEGYNTDVGVRGLAMSGGQKQRICIARALIRNPSILLLDEATSSLDSESEKHVQEAIERTAKGRTVVVVAHRLATVQNADVIFVFGEGGIVETGTHSDLLKRRGIYYQMCESQALDR